MKRQVKNAVRQSVSIAAGVAKRVHALARTVDSSMELDFLLPPKMARIVRRIVDWLVVGIHFYCGLAGILFALVMYAEHGDNAWMKTAAVGIGLAMALLLYNGGLLVSRRGANTHPLSGKVLLAAIVITALALVLAIIGSKVK